jgi:3-phenylpropionate/cinnamic acid dioxygenase small subunit
VTFATGRYLDRIVRDGEALRFRSRRVVLDSRRVDILLVLPL